MYTKNTPERPTTELFISRILDREACDEHKMPIGIPCWHIHTTSDGYKPAVCNERAKKAGFDSNISEKSLLANSQPKRGHRGYPR